MPLDGDRIRAAALESWFDLVGIAPSRPAPLTGRLHDWLERGMHGTMQYMEDPVGRREDPRVYLPWARSIVVVGLSYFTGDELSTAPERGAISRYAWGRDYRHEV